MATHYIKGSGFMASLFGIGSVEALCGTKIPAANGPANDTPCNCHKCNAIYNGSSDDGPKMFLGIF